MRKGDAKGAVGPIEVFLTADHVRIDQLLREAERDDGTIDQDVYARFRAELLRHIAMEEKVLLPFAKAKRGGVALELAKPLRDDHGKIARLLVPSPTPSLLQELRALLIAHNPLEEGPDALYALCDELAGDDPDAVMDKLVAYPPVPVAPHYDGPLLRRG